jgi:phosphohistidine phosphatase
MKLFIMRHGPAEDESADGQDASRTLTKIGRERVYEVARKLKDAGELPTTICSSPLARAKETAEILKEVLSIELSLSTLLAPGQKSIELVKQLRKEGTDNVILVGHEPDLSLLSVRLLGHALPTGGFSKAMVLGLSFDDNHESSLRFLLDPKSLQFVVDHRADEK